MTQALQAPTARRPAVDSVAPPFPVSVLPTDKIWALSAGELDHLFAVAESAGGQAATLSQKTPAATTPSRPSNVAVIPIVGVLTKEMTWFTRFFGGTSTLETSALLAEAIANPEIKRLILFVDSPGGTVRGIGELALEIFRARAVKPIVAFASDATASAAYYLAAQASRVFALESSLVGGIGVFAVVDDSSAAFEAGGVRRHVVRSAKLKGAGVPGTEVTPEQLAEIQAVVDDHAELFIASVARGRGVSTNAIRKVADGRVHSGRAALGLGLVDEIVGTFGDVIARAAGQPTSPGVRASLAELRDGLPTAAYPDFVKEAWGGRLSVAAARQEWERRSAAAPAVSAKREATPAAYTEAELNYRRRQAALDPAAAPPPRALRRCQGPREVPTMLSATERWERAVNAEVKAGKPRDAAVQAVNKTHPGLRQMMLFEFHRENGNPQVAADWKRQAVAAGFAE